MRSALDHLIVLAAAVALVLPATARAEPVVEVGHGQQPSAVTDAAGTLHVLWRDVTAPMVPLLYCRVPAGGSSCTPVELAHWATWFPHLLLRPQDGALIALFSTLDDVDQVLVSTDGGTTWSGPTTISAGLGDIYDAELTPDGGFVDMIRGSGIDSTFQRAPLGGGVEQRLVSLGRAESVRWPRLTHLPDGRPVVIAHFTPDRLGARVPAAGADPDVQAAWGPVGAWRQLGNTDASDADAGPTGTWLAATDEHPQPDGHPLVRIRRWGAHGFALPRTIGALARPAPASLGEADSTPFGAALDVDLAGRLHVAWTRAPQQCGGQHCLVYRRTERGGFDAPVVYPVGSDLLDQPERFAVAANSGGSGWLVWAALGDRIRAVPLVTPTRGARVGSRRIGRRRVTIPDFYGCVPSGGVFTARLRVDGRRGARIVSVRFSFDAGQPARSDRRAPYRVRFRLAFPPGTRHVVRATVRYGGGRSVSVGRTFVMC
jgi:hypothetical protein